MALILLLAIAALIPAPCPADTVSEDPWIQVGTEHFTLLSNAGEKTTREIGDRLEQLWQVLAATFADVASRPPTWIYVFRNERTIAPFKIGPSGQPDSVAGYYLATPLANYLVIDASADEGPFRAVYHEFVHYFLHNNLPYAPLWLNEGLAEYYSTIRLGHTRAELGRPIDEHRRWLAAHDLIPLPELFRITPDSPQYHAGIVQGTFYAESWALTHYLMSRPNKQGMPSLLRELRRGAPAEEALPRAFQQDLATTAREVHSRYAGDRRLPEQEWRFAEWQGRPARTRPLALADVLFHLGDLLTHRVPIQFVAAEQYLRAALTADSTRADCHASLGQLRHVAGRYAESHALYERALELAPDDRAIRLRFGQSLLEECFASEQGQPLSAPVTPPLLLRARAELRPLIETDQPGVEDELAFGRTFLLDRGGVSEGIAALSWVVQQEPWRTDALRDLIAVTAHAGDLAGARSLLEELRPRGTPELVRQAEAILADEERRAATSSSGG